MKEDMVDTLIGVSTVPAYGQVHRVQSVKVEIKSAMPSSKLEYGALILSLQTVNRVLFARFCHVVKHDSACCTLGPSCHPCYVEVIFQDSGCCFYTDGLLWLFHLSSCLGQLVSSVIPHDIGVSRDPLEI